MKIGHLTIEHCVRELQYKLVENQAEMNKAYIKGGETLAVSLSLKISPSNKGNKVVTGIKFVLDQVDDKNTSFVDEDQIQLFDPDPVPGIEFTFPSRNRIGGGPGLYRGIC